MQGHTFDVFLRSPVARILELGFRFGLRAGNEFGARAGRCDIYDFLVRSSCKYMYGCWQLRVGIPLAAAGATIQPAEAGFASAVLDLDRKLAQTTQGESDSSNYGRGIPQEH